MKGNSHAVWSGTAGFGEDMPPLSESLGFLVRMVQLQSFQLFYRRLDGAGLSVGALTALGAIQANPGIRHGVLADALMIKRPNFTKLINALERAGYITRDAPCNDKRTTVLAVTRKGAAKLEAMRQTVLAYHEEMMAALSPSERDVLLDLLRRVSRQLQGLLDTVDTSEKSAKPRAAASVR
jgi:DNA-binding MarR family transcriptional regulator